MDTHEQQELEESLTNSCQESITRFRSVAQMFRSSGRVSLAAKADAYADEQVQFLNARQASLGAVSNAA